MPPVSESEVGRRGGACERRGLRRRAEHLGLSGYLTLSALFLHLALTRSGSYLVIPGAPVFLADGLLVLGAAGGLIRSGFRIERWMVLSSLALATFLAAQYLRSEGQPQALVVRDLAPFVYLALVPGLAAALRGMSAGAFLLFLRGATVCLAATVLLRLLGLLQPVSLGAFTQIPLFLERPDAEGCVLALGVVAWGNWQGLGRGSRGLQVAFFALGTVNYTRAGLISVLLAAGYALWRERDRLTAGATLPSLLLIGSLSTILLSGAVAGAGLPNVGTPEALDRILASDTASGTTGARLNAWRLILTYADQGDATLQGFGPGTSPVANSGAVAYLSGSLLVRAAHSWPITAVAYFGLIGLGLWGVIVLSILWRSRGTPLHGLMSMGVVGYIAVSLFGVLIESPFGSVPLCVLLSWLVAQKSPDEAAITDR